MPAQFRISQVTPGAGTAGQSRHDLIAGEIITLTVTDPAPAVGTTFAWEIIDKRGSTATLSAATGQTVTIGSAGAIVSPCAFLIELTVTTLSGVTRVRRIASVRTAISGLRVPVFPETAPDAQKLSLNTPDLSTDNALYADRSGTGVSQQNWAGWSEWAWEVVNAIEAATVGGGPPTGAAGGDLRLTYPNPQVKGLYGIAIDSTAASVATGQALVFDGTNYKPAAVGLGKDYAMAVVGNELNGDTADMCDFLDPGDGTGIEAAIAAVEALGGGDVVVRTGDYDFIAGGVVTPMVIPASVRVRGLTPRSTTIIARMTPGTGESMSVFTVNGELLDIEISIAAPGVANEGAETYFVYVNGGRCERVTLTFGTIIAGDHADFSPIVAAFEYGGAAELVDCRVSNAPSFLWSGGSDHFIGFYGTQPGGDPVNIAAPFRLTRCASYSSSIERGTDTAFKSQYGPGFITNPTATNPRAVGVHLTGLSYSVLVEQPIVRWEGSDPQGRYAVVFGEISGNALTVRDCEVNGGYTNIDTAAALIPTAGVLFRSGANGNILRNKCLGMTIIGFRNGAQFSGVAGTVDKNSVQLCVFDSIALLDLVQSGDSGTIFDNNVPT